MKHKGHVTDIIDPQKSFCAVQNVIQFHEYTYALISTFNVCNRENERSITQY